MRSLFIPIAAILTAAAPIVARKCRAVPGSEDWPTAEKWAALNETVSGRLIDPVPPAAVCHESMPQYDRFDCENVKTQWKSSWFHSEDPVSMEFQNWTNDTCLPDVDAPCSGAGYPAYVIDAMVAEDIQAGIKFGEFLWGVWFPTPKS